MRLHAALSVEPIRVAISGREYPPAHATPQSRRAVLDAAIPDSSPPERSSAAQASTAASSKRRRSAPSTRALGLPLARLGLPSSRLGLQTFKRTAWRSL